ncbi:MAG: cryptochrome/photolyase family protein [Pedobacter sp.]|nr:cryptochrome/photolyase family protein [Chitinophagaceae bacterium]
MEPNCDIKLLVEHLLKQSISTIYYVDVIDNWLEKRLVVAAKKVGIKLVKYSSPNFLNKLADVADFFDKKKTYFQTDFYTWQRKQRHILLEKDGKPLGGKWTYDADNRSKFPKGETVPKYPFPTNNEFVKEAREYVAKNFTNNYGFDSSPFANSTFYPTTFTEAEEWLESFLQQRFSKFGIYEDAIVSKEQILYHSVLTPMLNIGLLSPQQILDTTLDFASANDIPLNSLEGFIRQIMGWREFIRIVYERKGTLQRTKNYWEFTRKIPASFYNGTTGILPIDNVIKKLLKSGYNHHIERLMVLGNFMLLCEFDPNEVHQWFMEMYIDSYDWVMVPNVYGMTQFADGGLMTTKPYISGSNYLMKMSDYEKGSWQEIWDGLFWRFMQVHRSFFLKNPRLGMLVGTFDKMSEEKRQNHLNNAEVFLGQL